MHNKKNVTQVPYKPCDVYRLLDHLYTQDDGQSPLLGDALNPKHDLVNIQSHITFGHKASGVQQVVQTADGKYNVLLNNLSLAGMYGALPDTYGEEIADRKNQDMRDFLDIFHHRLMGLLYRFYRKNRIFLGSKNVKNNIIGKILHNLTGLSLFQKQFQFQETGIFPLFNLFWKNGSSISGVKELIRGYFHVKTKVVPFLGGWIYPDKKVLSYLNKSYQALGKSLFIGRKTWDDTYGFTICIGPLDFKQYVSFIPPMQQNFPTLKQLLFYYIDNSYHVRLQLYLKSDTVPALHLGKCSYLNFTTWLSPASLHVKDTHVTAVV
ncbi:MAG: type VI secretion system baseplate subunit TssG [Pseudomonadota bacterium]